MTLTIISMTAPGGLGELVLWVPGRPQTAGSKTAMPVRTKDGGTKTVVVESGTSSSRQAKKTWRGDLRDAAGPALAEQWGLDEPTRRALEARWVFVMRRPSAHLRTGVHAGQVKDSARPLRPVTRPDATKLQRAAEDALTGVLWVDDSQIVDQYAAKVFGDQIGRDPQTEGLLLIVREALPYSGRVPLGAPASS